MRFSNRARAVMSIPLILTGLTLTGLAACGTNHDAPNPERDIQFQWVRVETPPSYTTLMVGCLGNTALIMDQNDGNTFPDDNSPFCPITNVFNPAIQAKYHFKIVVREGHNGAGTS